MEDDATWRCVCAICLAQSAAAAARGGGLRASPWGRGGGVREAGAGEREEAHRVGKWRPGAALRPGM